MIPKLNDKQKIQFLWNVLWKIARNYQTPEQLRKNSERQFGCDYEEAIQMSYENIQQDAKNAIKRIKYPRDIDVK